MHLGERYCRKCKNNTFHEITLKGIRCMHCGKVSLIPPKINYSKIDFETPTRYLFSNKEFYYFFDYVGVNLIRKEDLEKLEGGDKIRIPVYACKRGKELI